MPFNSDEERKAFFARQNSNKVSSNSISNKPAVAGPEDYKNKMLRTTKEATEFTSIKTDVIPKYRKYIHLYFPHTKTKPGRYIYTLQTREQLGRKGKYDQYDGDVKWMIHEKSMPEGGVIGPENMLENHPELSALWFKVQTVNDPRVRDNFMRAYMDTKIDQYKEHDEDNGKQMVYKIVKDDDRYSIAEIQTPEQQFLEAVQEGKIKENGLKLSLNQVKGRPPNGGWFNKFDYEMTGSEQYPKFQKNLKRGIYTGLVVTIDDADPSLDDYYKSEMIVTEIIDDYHYRVRGIPPYGGNLIIRDTDIRGVQADQSRILSPAITNEYYERHLKPAIEKYMKNP